jgi:hypothetical protein
VEKSASLSKLFPGNHIFVLLFSAFSTQRIHPSRWVG